jgi:hypothetical protein
LFARDSYGINQYTPDNFYFELLELGSKPSGQILTRTKLLVQTARGDDGSFDVYYSVTAAGFYTVMGALTQSGGLAATYYNSLSLQMMPSFDISTGKVQASVTPIACAFVNFESAGMLSVDACGGSTLIDYMDLSSKSLFSAKFAGYIQPLHSETYTLSLISPDSASVFVDGLKIIHKTSAIWQVDGTIAVQAMTMYPILVEYIRDSGANISIVLKWKSRSQGFEAIPSSRMCELAYNHPMQHMFYLIISVQVFHIITF